MGIRIAIVSIAVMGLSFGISGPLSIIMSVTSIRITVVTITVMGLSLSRSFAVVMTIVMGIRITIAMAVVTIMRLSGCSRFSFSGSFRLGSGSGFSISVG